MSKYIVKMIHSGVLTTTILEIKKFFSEGKEVELWGIAGKMGNIISSNVMKKLLKK